MKHYSNKIQIVSYIDQELYNRIAEERMKTGETQSGIVYSVLDAVFREPMP
jgi:hypothetical protein